MASCRHVKHILFYGNGTLTIYLDEMSISAWYIQNLFKEATYQSQIESILVDGKILDGKTFSGSINGKIDEVSVWSRSLSDSEIQSHMLTSPISGEEGLVGYWNFNEGEGTTLYDLTGNANHGTINGATWSTDVPVLGCTDPYADNYNEDAVVDDGSCSGYPDNGEYVLSFDGVDDFVNIPILTYSTFLLEKIIQFKLISNLIFQVN